jgi:hypothetical protein
MEAARELSFTSSGASESSFGVGEAITEIFKHRR